MPDDSLSEQLRLSHGELETRLAFLTFSENDRANLRDIAAVIRRHLDALIDDFYRHLLKFAELRAILADPALLARLKQSQREYLLSFESATFDTAYAERRFRIGLVHERVGLAQKWYLGAYRHLAELIVRRLADRYAGDAPRLTSLTLTLHKTFRLDEIFVVEAYYHNTTQRLEQSLRELTEAHRQMELLSRLDPLTQIANRRALLEALDKELRRSRRYHRRLALLFLDVDHFKTINDEHGHAFGDRVLRHLTGATAALIRLADIFGRYGGEEFVIGLVECDEPMAEEVAERIRQTIARTAFEWDGHRAHITVSIGVALSTPEMATLDALIEQADRALYRAKTRGRNRVELYRPSPPA